MDKLAGIIGFPLSHTISPVFQQAAFDHYALPVRYHAWPTPPEELARSVERLRGSRYLGANVTVPHKESVFEYLDEIDPRARTIGAVNTIVSRSEKLVGYNTDAHGFIRALRSEAGFQPKGARVLLLGAGGAARAAAFALVDEGIAALVIANRTVGRARSLADDVRGPAVQVDSISMSPGPLADASGQADLIVNATSVGMSGGDADGATPLAEDLIPAGALVFDMVYNPSLTLLLAAATRAGARTLGGLPMLVFQGAQAFQIWTGKEAPIDVMSGAAEKALAGLAAA